MDSVGAFLDLVESHGVSPERIGIVGDSVGGGLCLGATRALLDRNQCCPGALALISPIGDLGRRPQPDHDRTIPSGFFDLASSAYLADGGPCDPAYAPLQGDLTGLPPTLVQAVAGEMLLPQAHAVTDALRAANVDVRFDVFHDLWHAAHLQAFLVPEAASAVAELTDFIRPRIMGAHDRSPGSTTL